MSVKSAIEPQETIPATFAIDHIKLVVAISKHLDKCEGVKYVNPRQFNAVIKAANIIVAEYAKADQIANAGTGLDVWLRSDDRGMSSNYMAHVLGGSDAAKLAYPYDCSDFGRCVRLLDVVPVLRTNLAMMSDTHPVWKSLVDAWDELEAMYRREEYEQVSHRIRKMM